MNGILKLWQKLSAYPGGKRVFSRLIGVKVPYFATIQPRFELLEPGRSVVTMRQRRAVHNHLGYIHAIAQCNLAEVAAGLVSEVSTPKGMRWIPAGMTVRYLAPARGVLRAEATLREIVVGEKGAVPVTVVVTDEAGKTVFDASIEMYFSPKPEAAAAAS